MLLISKIMYQYTIYINDEFIVKIVTHSEREIQHNVEVKLV